MAALTTSEVESLLTKHNLLLRTPVKKRERFLPTKSQLEVTITFLLASEKCKSIKHWEMTWAAPKRAVCISEAFYQFEPEVKEWVRKNPEDFEKMYERVVWRGLYGESPI